MAEEKSAMLHVSVKYYNIVADFLGQREERRAVALGTSMRDLIEALANESASFRRLVYTSGTRITGQVRIFRNEQAVLDLDEPLADGDEIRIFPAISGG